jgi:hypothetical protein
VEQAKLIIKPAHMEVKMKPGFWPDLKKMQDTVKESGFTPMPENVGLVVSGKVVRRAEGFALELDRMKSALVLPLTGTKDDPDTVAHLERHLGQTVGLEGLWQPPPKDETGPGSLAVTAVAEAREKG